MYSYHGRIKQRIRNGELMDFYYTDQYPGIGRALVLVFCSAPYLRPIRPHRYGEYTALLETWHSGREENTGTRHSGMGPVGGEPDALRQELAKPECDKPGG